MILDVSRNPGGSTCSLESLASRFASNPMTSLQMRYRVTWDYLQSLRSDLDFAIYFGDPPEDIAALQNMVTDAERAYKENRGMSDLTPMCSYSPKLTAPIADTGRPVVYSKPVLLLIDDLSFSAAEAFAALMQDNQRATLFGYRTDGAGGAVDYRDVGIYSETGTSFAFTILERLQNIATGDFPLAPYIENLGVRPDKEFDPMTEDNLLQRGKPFVDAFTSAVVDLIRAKKGS
jgi:C-terminal processing protease CtpA/Prc